MAEKLFGLKLGNSPKQWWVAGGLTAVLVGVLAFNRDDTPEPPISPAPSEDAAGANSQASDNPRRSTPVDKVRVVRKSPAVRKRISAGRLPDLSSALKHDPFAIPSAIALPVQPEIAPQTAVAEATDEDSVTDARRQAVQQTLNDLRSKKIMLIFRQGDGAAALIGDRVVKEGQIIDGVKIESISPRGITVLPVDSP